jgi:peptidoglycan L-alanyl-D-glutamate endopeptidase CwlK
MTFQLSQKSKDRLTGVHPDLVSVVNRALELSEVDFAVLEGVRSLAKQEQLLAAKATTTLKSRHLTGHAVDLGAVVAGTVRWDWPLYHKIADAMKDAAEQLGIPLEWGGDWKTFKDGPHFQLPWQEYPA